MGFIQKNLGLILSIVGAGITILSGINDKKEQERKIDEAVAKAVSERLN